MPRPLNQKAYGQAMWERLKQDATNASGIFSGQGHSKKLSLDEKLAVWNDRALSVEQEWELWRQGRTPESIARGEKPLSPEEIGLKVFPKREQLYKSGGNVEPKDWIKEANYLAQEAEKRRRTERPTIAEVTGAPEVTEMGSAAGFEPAAPSASGTRTTAKRLSGLNLRPDSVTPTPTSESIAEGY